MSSHSMPARGPEPGPHRPSSAGGGSPGTGARRAVPGRLLEEPESDRYEYRHLSLPRGTTRGQARALLTEHAEYGRWELSGVVLFRGGARQVRLRRRIIRVQRTA